MTERTVELLLWEVLNPEHSGSFEIPRRAARRPRKAGSSRPTLLSLLAQAAGRPIPSDEERRET